MSDDPKRRADVAAKRAAQSFERQEDGDRRNHEAIRWINSRLALCGFEEAYRIGNPKSRRRLPEPPEVAAGG
jgi:hypothetical protein